MMRGAPRSMNTARAGSSQRESRAIILRHYGRKHLGHAIRRARFSIILSFMLTTLIALSPKQRGHYEKMRRSG